MAQNKKPPPELFLMFYSGEEEDSLLGAIKVADEEEAFSSIDITLRLKNKKPILKWVLKNQDYVILKTWPRKEIKLQYEPIHLS